MCVGWCQARRPADSQDATALRLGIRPSPVPDSADFTHWHLAGGAEVEILNFLDDHSRYLLACRRGRNKAG